MTDARWGLLALFVATTTGCGSAESPVERTESEGAAVRSELCPMVWAPVCGRDGVTYSNVCVAGGQGNVAYEGVCTDLCAAVLCMEGTVCEVQGNRARCVAPRQKGNGSFCALKCAAPPDGCHYEGAVLNGPCQKLTCGTLVCDGTL